MEMDTQIFGWSRAECTRRYCNNKECLKHMYIYAQCVVGKSRKNDLSCIMHEQQTEPIRQRSSYAIGVRVRRWYANGITLEQTLRLLTTGWSYSSPTIRKLFVEVKLRSNPTIHLCVYNHQQNNWPCLRKILLTNFEAKIVNIEHSFTCNGWSRRYAQSLIHR